MELFSNTDLLWVFLSSIPIGIFAIVMGGTMFLSIPVFQILIPEFTLGAIVGTVKVGRVLGNAIALAPLKKNIQPKKILFLSLILCITGAIGALGLTSVSNSYILPAILIAMLVMEGAPWLSTKMNRSWLTIAAIAVGIYGGFIGAGTSLIILALLRLYTPGDEKIVEVRSQGIYLEMINSAAAVAVIAFSGILVTPIWLAWTAGSIIGSYIGGIIIERTGKMPPHIQKWMLRAVFLFAICVAVWRMGI